MCGVAFKSIKEHKLKYTSINISIPKSGYSISIQDKTNDLSRVALDGISTEKTNVYQNINLFNSNSSFIQSSSKNIIIEDENKQHIFHLSQIGDLQYQVVFQPPITRLLAFAISNIIILYL